MRNSSHIGLAVLAALALSGAARADEHATEEKDPPRLKVGDDAPGFRLPTHNPDESGIKYVVVHPGTGKDMPKPYDNVTFNYSAWDADTRMVETASGIASVGAASAATGATGAVVTCPSSASSESLTVFSAVGRRITQAGRSRS